MTAALLIFGAVVCVKVCGLSDILPQQCGGTAEHGANYDLNLNPNPNPNPNSLALALTLSLNLTVTLLRIHCHLVKVHRIWDPDCTRLRHREGEEPVCHEQIQLRMMLVGEEEQWE